VKTEISLNKHAKMRLTCCVFSWKIRFFINALKRYLFNTVFSKKTDILCNAPRWVHFMYDVWPILSLSSHLMYYLYLFTLSSCPYYPFLGYSFLLSDERVYKRMLCMKTMRFWIRRNIIKAIPSALSSSIQKSSHSIDALKREIEFVWFQ
jgi:hypothetical protein